LNFQGEGYELHYGQILEQNTIQRLWDELKVSCEFEHRKAEAVSFNNDNKWRKRGVAMIPTKFGISFTAKFMNQVSLCFIFAMQIYWGNISIAHNVFMLRFHLLGSGA
jgi:xanthine dehydrogenase molybdopterin-binding subunit B